MTIALYFVFLVPSVAACGDNYFGRYGTVTTPGYPGTYENNVICNWIITAPEGTTILLKFIHFDIEGGRCIDDYLQITGSTTYNNTQLCGNNLPEPISSVNNTISFSFHSNGRGQYTGFQIEWKVNNIFEWHSDLVTEIEAQSTCIEKGGTLVMDFADYDIIQRLVANNATDIWHDMSWVLTQGCYMFEDLDGFKSFFKFKTNEMSMCVVHTTGCNYFGLHGEQCFCFETLDGTSVDTAQNCQTPCPGNAAEKCGGNNALTVYMNDSTSDMPEPQQCSTLYLKDGLLEESVSDCNSSKPFLCQYVPVACGEHFEHVTNGMFSTPNYPHGYGPLLHCVWIISVPQDHSLMLTIHVDIEQFYLCLYDYVKVYNGDSVDGQPSATLCGNTTEMFNQTDTTTIQFRSDKTLNSTGMFVEFLIVPILTTPTAEPSLSSTTPTESGQHESKQPTNAGQLCLSVGAVSGLVVVLVILMVVLLICICMLIIRRRSSADVKLKTVNKTVSAKANGTNHAKSKKVPSPDNTIDVNISSEETYSNPVFDESTLDVKNSKRPKGGKISPPIQAQQQR